MKKIEQEILSNILAEAGRRMIRNRELANGMGMSPNTLMRRIRNPEELSLAEINGAAKLFGIKALDLIVRG